jgi:hypothetical protein
MSFQGLTKPSRACAEKGKRVANRVPDALKMRFGAEARI